MNWRVNMERFVADRAEYDSWEWYIFDDIDERVIAGPMSKEMAIDLAKQLNEGLL